MPHVVNIDGRKIGVVEIGGQRVLLGTQIVFIHGLGSSTVNSILSVRKDEFTKEDTFPVPTTILKELGFRFDGKGCSNRRVFTESGYVKLMAGMKNRNPIALKYFHSEPDSEPFPSQATGTIWDGPDAPVLRPTVKALQERSLDEYTPREGVLLDPITMHGKKDGEDEVLDIAIKIVADRKRMKALEAENERLRTMLFQIRVISSKPLEEAKID